jgi:Flp pilus assembly protein TadD
MSSQSNMSGEPELEHASRLLNAGKYAECAAICAAIVARDAGNALATHLLGLAIKETGDWEQGEQWLRLSLQLGPGCAEFHTNLANLLRRREKYRQAESFYRRALDLAPDHLPARRGLALTLNDLGRFAEAEATCRELIAAEADNAETWVLLGLTLCNLQRLSESEAAYRRAIALDPHNRIAHHNLGAVLSQMERPEAAFAALQSAGTLGEESYELAFNRGRALLDLNAVEAAEQEFDRAVTIKPSSVDAQLQLARVRYMLGDPKFARSLADAAAANRDDVGLHLLFAEVLWRAGKLSGAEAVLHDLLTRKVGGAHVLSTLASVLHEGGRLKEAESFAMQAASAAPADAVIIENLVSILLSRGRPEDAMPFIKTHRALAPDSQAWVAYEATAARLLDNEAYPHLYDYDRLIRVFDVEAPPGWSSMQELNAALAKTLADRHRLRSHPLDQSLRNGTQTSRSLLAESDPAIKAILSAFEHPIEEYRRLIGTDTAHPFSARNSGRARFTGAWSVRLRRLGYHVNHFHPDGWISSAYYVDVPPETADPDARSGWIKFGEPRYEVPGARAERFIQPRPGRLVLFPSYMWHGTTPIHADAPRLTIAFDVKPV